MKLSVLYRGPLSSCNYACSYCPFAKRHETKSQLERDRSTLSRFKSWIADQSQHRWTVLLTPWGEALIRSWYRSAIEELSQLAHLDAVAVQTNLSCDLDWFARCRRDKLSLWATYHPTEVSADVFLRRVQAVYDLGIRICVGVVGVPEFLERIPSLQQRLPDDVYLWINAQQPRRRPYTDEEIARFQAIDPHFLLTFRRQPSFGKPCQAGETSFTIDGAGDMRRCHFVDEVIGNCYEPDWEQVLQSRNCPNKFCDCFLGKSQLLSARLGPYFGSTALQRLPNESLTP